MTTLPDALRPWREWLSWFEPDLAVQLGPMLQRLHPLLGSFRGHSQGGEPELEGLDDLRLRGSYQHLLASEWLLAEDMPDEFLRRAASGEHMFLAPRPRARRADRSVIALFDSGPLQLGAPRLAHIAIWILLARRAQQAQAEFRWGSLQSPGELFEARSTGNLKTLLFRRTFALPNAASLAAWRNALDERRTSGELWAIGASFDQTELQVAPSFTHRVCLQKDLQGTALDVSLFERGTQRGTRLPLPESNSAAPLLRGWFNREASPQQYTRHARAVALKRPPVISLDGTRVCMALRDEPGALVFMIPRSAMDHAAEPRYLRWSGGFGMLAITCVGKHMGALLSDERELRFWGNSLIKMPHPTQEEFHAPGSTAAWLSLGWLRAKSAQRVCVIDHSRRLLQWDFPFDGKSSVPAEQSLRLRAKEVLAIVQYDSRSLAYAYHENGTVWFTRLSATHDGQAPRPLCKAPPDAAILFGRGNICAVRLNKLPAETWAIGTCYAHGLTMQAQLPGDSRAIGLLREPSSGRTGLITLDRNILRLNYIDGGNEVLYAAPDRIVSCTVCPNTGITAMLTQRRQLIVLSAATRELRLSVQTSPQSHESA
jgi:hypothetical protein